MHLSTNQPDCVVVAGMHRSGTSLVAGLLQTLGIGMGSRLVPADHANPRGYFEDRDMVDFHQRVFHRRFADERTGHPDWGWTPAASVHPDDARPFVADATALVARRSAAGYPWGFKDPRTTVLLDFWHALLPSPVYIGVYREPSAVAQSMQRLGADVFLRHPDYARKIWGFYNQHLLNFARRHRERMVLVNADALRTDVERLPGLLRARLGLSVPEANLRARVIPSLLRRSDHGATLTRLSRWVWPECATLYDELEAIADMPAVTSATATPAFRFQPRVPSGELSVVIPTHNDATLLVEALASAVDSTPDHHEILVLDDGTTDAESLRILDRLRAAGLSIPRQENRGLPVARNTLIRAARGRLILPLDADNLIGNGFVEAAIDAFHADPGLGVVYGDRQTFGGQTALLLVPDFDLHRMLQGNTIDACALFRRELWTDVGGYDESLRLGFEDWEFWLHAGKRGWRFQHLPMIGVEYRVRPDSLLTRAQSPEGRSQFRALMMRKHPDLVLALLPIWYRAACRIRPPLRSTRPALGWWRRRIVEAHLRRVW